MCVLVARLNSGRLAVDETTHMNLQVEVDIYCSVAKLDKGISTLFNCLKISSHVLHNSLTLQLSSHG